MGIAETSATGSLGSLLAPNIFTDRLSDLLLGRAPHPDPVGDLVRRGDTKEISDFVTAHPDQFLKVETELMRSGDFGAVYRLAQSNAAKAKVDYDTPIWLRYGKAGGPGYRTRPDSDDTNRVSTSAAWDPLVANGSVTASQRAVISRMADNEGRLDSIQAYDSEIATVGAMQKTINSGGTGELPQQVWNFAQSNPAAYKTLFSDNGWTVEHTGKGTGTNDYTMSLTVDGKTMTGSDLAAYIKDKAHPDQWKTALDPLLQAGRDPAFQAQQISDFKARLDTAISVIPKGKSYTKPISAYVTSEQASALVLDEHVNRPGHVAGSFGRALDGFFKANPKADRDPANWTAEQRAVYEPAIVTLYQAQRAASNMTDPGKRYDHIVSEGTPLNATPGSYVASNP